MAGTSIQRLIHGSFGRVRGRTWLPCAAAIVLAALGDSAGAAIVRISVGPGGVEARGDQPQISASGRHVIFRSSASNLVPNDTNGVDDIFAVDRDPDGNGIFDEGNQTVRRISVSSTGQQANAACGFPRISPNGRFVVFQSNATNLVTVDTNGTTDVFLHDRDPDGNGVFDEGNGTTERASIGTGGSQATTGSFSASVSADGRLVAFTSFEQSFTAPAQTDSYTDAFARDRVSGLTSVISINSAGQHANNHSTGAVLTSNGRFVAFASVATNLAAGILPAHDNIFVRDRTQNVTVCCSISTAGTAANGGCRLPAMSSDGRYVFFSSKASNLVTGDPNGVADVFVRDRDTDNDGILDEPGAVSTRQLSSAFGGGPTLGESGESGLAVTPNGRVVAFAATAINLIFDDTNGVSDIFVRNRDADNDGILDEADASTTSRISVSASGAPGNGTSDTPSIADDGRQVAFASAASNLVPDDTNGGVDVFVHTCEPLAVTSQPAGKDACEGTQVSFSVGLSGSPGFGYQWRKDGTDIPEAGGSEYTFPSVTAADAGTYSVRVWNACSVVTSTGALLSVRALPAITSQPASRDVFDGGSATFSVAASGFAPLAFQWKRGDTDLVDGGSISGATTATVQVSPAHAGDAAADYHCVVTNSCGQAISEPATLSVNSSCVPPVVTSQPASQTTCAGDTARFRVAAGGTSLTYQWRKNGDPIPAATGSELVLSNVSTADAAGYDVVVHNDCGDEPSAVATLVVESKPNISVQPTNRTVCSGGSATFSVAATGTPAPTFQWRLNGVAIPGATSDSLALNPAIESDAGVYDVVAANSCGTATSTPATLTVNSPPVITSQPSGATVCPGASVTFRVTAEGFAPLRYQWRLNGSNISGATSATFARSSVVAADAGPYTVVVSNDCGAETSQGAVLTVMSAPVVTSQPAGRTACAGDAVSLGVQVSDATGVSYQWRKGVTNLADGGRISGATAATLTINPVASGDAASNYSCVVANACGSAASSLAALRVNSAPTIDTHPANATVESGGTLSLSVAAHGTAPLSFQWRKNTAAIAAATQSALILNPVSTADAGVYDCIVANGCGSRTSNAATVTVTGGSSGSNQPPSDPGSPANLCGTCGGGSQLALTLSLAALAVARRTTARRRG